MAHGFNPKVALNHGVIPESIVELSGEQRVAELMAQGCDNQAIAYICGYDSRQVANSQVQRIRRKLGWQAQ